MNKYSESVYFGSLSEYKELDKNNELYTISVTSAFQDADRNYPLKDGVYHDGGNTQKEFANAVNGVKEEMSMNKKVFVFCTHGQSRSISVLSTALASVENRSYQDVEQELIDISNNSDKPAESLRKKGKKFILHDTS